MLAALQDSVTAMGGWALVLVFIIVTLESSAFLGLLVPGETAVILTGALAAARILNLWSSYAVVITAATLGDVIGYLLGRYYGEAMLGRWSFARRHYGKHHARLEAYFQRWGAMTVIVGRFVAVGRAFAPFTAGLSKMEAGRFLPMAAIGGVLWGGGLVSLGYLFAENWRTFEHWLGRIGGGITGLLALTMAMLLLWRWLVRKETRLEFAWEKVIARPAARRFTFILARLGEFVRARFSPTGYLGLHLSLGLLVVAILAWAFGAVAQAIFTQRPLVIVDQQVAFFIDGLRNPRLDSLMAVLFFLGGVPWLLWMTAAIELGLAISGRMIVAVALALSLGGAYALGFGLETIFSALQPRVPAEKIVHGFAGFPDVSLVGATAAYTMLCFFGLLAVRSWRWRTLEVVGLAYLLMLIGLGALYHRAPLSSVLASYALGGCWVTICATGFQTWRRWDAHTRADAFLSDRGASGR